ncbi:MAG: carbohydrate ABC transporter permease [Fervidobacterium sp.]
MTKVSVRKFKESLLAYLFLLPALVVLSVFTFWPVGFSFVLSFFKWDFRNMKSPYFYGLGNYKEVLKFDYPVKFPFHLGLIYSFMYIAISILIVFAIFGVIDIFRKKRVEGSTLLSIISIITYFVVKNNVSPLFVLIFDVVLYILIFVLFKTKVPDRNLMTEHAWLAAAIGIVAYIFTEFRYSAFFNGVSYGLIDYMLDAAEKNLFFKALVNTTYYVVLTVPVGLTLALLIALLLNQDIRVKAFFRTAFFIPFVTSSVAVGLIWKWIYNDDVGLLNYILSTIGLQPVKWLKDARWTIPTVSIVSIWKSVGYNAMIFLAGLQNIDTFYYEAADVDGANSIQKFLKITWPLLSPTTFFLLIVSVIGAFKVFQEVFVLYDGLPGPYGNSGMTMVYYVFDLFYRQQRMGIASAAAYLLFMVILVFTIIQYRVGDKVVEYVS